MLDDEFWNAVDEIIAAMEDDGFISEPSNRYAAMRNHPSVIGKANNN